MILIPFFIITVVMSILSVHEPYTLYVDEDGNLFCSDGYTPPEK